MLQRLRDHILMPILLIVVWAIFIYSLDPISNYLTKHYSKIFVLTGLLLASVISALVFGRAFKKFAWVGQNIAKTNISHIAVAAFGGLIVVGASIAISSAFGYVSICINCGNAQQYLELFTRGLELGGAEEVFHSAILLSAIMMIVNRNAWIATVIFSMLFVRLHSHELRPDLLHQLRLMLAGATFSQLTLRCKSIWPSVALHGMIDGLIGAFLQGDANANPVFVAGMQQPAIFEIIPLFGILVIFGWIDLLGLRNARKRRVAIVVPGIEPEPGANSANSSIGPHTHTLSKSLTILISMRSFCDATLSASSLPHR